MVGGVFWIIDRNALAYACSKSMDNVNKAKSVRFVVNQKIGNQPELETRVFILGDSVRYEVSDLYGNCFR